MTLGNTGRLGDQRGLALFTVTVFVFIVTLVGLAYFAVAGYETHGALYRQNSSEAFFLADAGVERARAEFAKDLAWRGPLTDVAEGNGAYSVTVTDATWNGSPTYTIKGIPLDILKVHSEGTVRNAKRAIDTWVTVPNFGIAKQMIVMRDIDAKGNICLDGDIHANGDADFGKDDVHLKCGGTYTEGFYLKPPKIYTEPGHYPNSTYYYVVGNNIRGPGEPIDAKIFDRNGVEIQTALGDSLVGIVGGGGALFSYDFKSGDVAHYFDPVNGVFKLDTAAGNTSVVVNFGAIIASIPASVADIQIQMTGGQSIKTTIINTRFFGATDDDRLNWMKWRGGTLRCKTKATFEPDNGVAMVLFDFDQNAAQVTVGTAANPALLYVTRDVPLINGNMSITGALIVLRDLTTRGGPTLTYNDGFIQKLPFGTDWWTNAGTTGEMVVLDWREVAPNP